MESLSYKEMPMVVYTYRNRHTNISLNNTNAAA